MRDDGRPPLEKDLGHGERRRVTQVISVRLERQAQHGDARPGPNDWEATVRTADRQHLPPGTYELRVGTPDGHELCGHAVLRYSDGAQHLFRGDGELGGVDAALA